MSADLEICPHCGADPDGGSGDAGCYARPTWAGGKSRHVGDFDPDSEIHSLFWCSNCRRVSARMAYGQRIPVNEGLVRVMPDYMREWLGRALKGEFDPWGAIA